MLASRGSRHLVTRRRCLRSFPVASYTTTTARRQNAFHSQLEGLPTSSMFPSSKTAVQTPQTLTEKIVQRYSVGLAPGKKVKAGDYVTLSP